MQPLAVITDSKIDLATLQAHVEDSRHGAIAQFVGVVRDHDHGRQVSSLDYQVHPDALAALERIAGAIAAGNPSVNIGVAHRYGQLHIGDIAFAAIVSSAHRDEAFIVLRMLVEQVKAELPIWKRQEFGDGTHEWVNFA